MTKHRSSVNNLFKMAAVSGVRTKTLPLFMHSFAIWQAKRYLTILSNEQVDIFVIGMVLF